MVKVVKIKGLGNLHAIVDDTIPENEIHIIDKKFVLTGDATGMKDYLENTWTKPKD